MEQTLTRSEDRTNLVQLCLLIPRTLDQKIKSTAARLSLSKSDVTRLILMGQLPRERLDDEDYLTQLNTARQDRLAKIYDNRTTSQEKHEYADDVEDIDREIARVKGGASPED